MPKAAKNFSRFLFGNKSIELVKFEFDNWVHYCQPGIEYYVNLLNDIDLWIETISYFEIAFDFQLLKALLFRISNIERNSTLDELNPNPKFRPLTKVKSFNKLHNGTMYTIGASALSSNGNGKQLCFYNKTNELADKRAAGKPKEHITEFHTANGLDESKDVERLEAKISNRWLTANNISLAIHDLANPEVLKTLLIKAVGELLKFKDIKSGSYDSNRNYKNKIIDLLPLESLQAQPVTLPSRNTSTNLTSDNKKRVTLKTLVTQFVESGKMETAAAIRHFTESNTPPKNATWDDLKTRYALSYEGRPTDESKDRIAQILTYTKPC